MSNQPPYDGSQGPSQERHDQPTQGVPRVESNNDDNGGQGTGSAEAQDPRADPWATPAAGSQGPAPEYGQQNPQYGQAPQYGQQNPQYGQAPQHGQQTPQYGQAPQYGQQTPQYGQGGYDAYGKPAEYQGGGPGGQGYGGFDQPGYYAQPGASTNNTSAIVLLVASGLAVFLCCGAGLPSLIMGIIAMTKQSNDPAGAAKLAKIGWIVFGVLVALAVIGFIVLLAVGAFADGSSSSYTNSYDDSTF